MAFVKSVKTLKRMTTWVVMLVLIACLPTSIVNCSTKATGKSRWATGKIAFIRGGDVWLANSDGADQRQLTKAGNSYRPSWSRDGQYLVCERRFNTRKTRWGSVHWNPSVWLTNVGTIQAKRLTPNCYKNSKGDMYATFSSDGRYVLFVKQELEEYVSDYLIAVNTQILKQTILAKE